VTRRTPLLLLLPLGLVAGLAACSDGDAAPTITIVTGLADNPDEAVDVAAESSSAEPSAPLPTEPATTQPATTTTTEPKVELPVGVLFAVPTQNREDPAKSQFQIQVHNGTDVRYDLSGVQFLWDGYSTPMTERDSIVVGGQIIDFPVPFPGATCVGDGTRDTMPTLDDARVVMQLDNGDTVELPIVDQWHLARKLYEEDCEKQMIESLVSIEWVDLHEELFEDRPVTAGELQLTRRDGVGEFAVTFVSNTIPFVFEAVDTAVDETVVTLEADADVASAPVRFIESRCDPHALAEIKQPTKFIAQIQLGDGSIHPYIIYPERSMWTPMRLTADKACVQLGKVVFVGD
jgi:hypothetical protein